MYEISPIKDDDYEDSYVYKAKNSAGQIMCFEVYKTTAGYLWVKFYITTKRRDGFQDGKQTGRDGLKSLFWAKNCLLHFLETKRSYYKGLKLLVQGADKRRFIAYKRSLEPLGFKEILDGTRTLTIEL